MMMVLVLVGEWRAAATADIARIWTEIDDVSKWHVINLAAPHFKCEFKMPLLQSPAIASPRAAALQPGVGCPIGLIVTECS